MDQRGRSVSYWRIFSLLLALGAAAWSSTAVAQVVGTVVQLTGTLSAQRGSATRILSMKSEVQRGDTLSTQANSYAQVQFTDNSTVTLRPNTTLRIDDYQFDQKEPGKDGIVMNLVKGGLRSVTGLIGKRGNQDAYKIQTSTATIGIRGSEGETMACTTGCAGTTSKSGGLPPGVYHVTNSDLYIMVTNQGSVLIGPGQFGFSNDINKPPVLLGGDPGLGITQIPFALGSKGSVQECSPR